MLIIASQEAPQNYQRCRPGLIKSTSKLICGPPILRLITVAIRRPCALSLVLLPALSLDEVEPLSRMIDAVQFVEKEYCKFRQ